MSKAVKPATASHAERLAKVLNHVDLQRDEMRVAISVLHCLEIALEHGEDFSTGPGYADVAHVARNMLTAADRTRRRQHAGRAVVTEALHRSDDPSTSVAAAAAVKTTELEDLVLEELFANPQGMTTRQIAAAVQRDLVSISPRMKPLVDKNAVKDSGIRTRGPSGRFQIVWQAVV